MKHDLHGKCRNISGGKQGFTLIELSIVLLIIGILTASLLGFAQVMMKKRLLEQTDEKMKQITLALAKYIADDPEVDISEDPVSYPCPAPLTAISGEANFGRPLCPSNFSNTTPRDLGGVFVVRGSGGRAVLVGAVPSSELMIEGKYMLDPYGNRFTYAVTMDLAKPASLLEVPPPEGAIGIQDESGTVTSSAPFALVSHGRNGVGAYANGGLPVSDCPSHLKGDAMNCQWKTSQTAVFRTSNAFTKTYDQNYFDDKTVYSFYLTEDEDGWWKATDDSGVHIVHKNPGNVGVGTDNPVAKFEVHGETDDSSAAAVNIRSGDKDNTIILNVRNDGRVGVGTDDPKRKLHVKFSNNNLDDKDAVGRWAGAVIESTRGPAHLMLRTSKPDAHSAIQFSYGKASDSILDFDDSLVRGAFAFDYTTGGFAWRSGTGANFNGIASLDRTGSLWLNSGAWAGDSIYSANLLVAGKGVRADTGNIIASSGNVMASGNVAASVNVEALNNVSAGNSAYAKHFYYSDVPGGTCTGTCESDGDSDLTAMCAAGEVLRGIQKGQPVCMTLTFHCSSGQALRGIVNGQPLCVSISGSGGDGSCGSHGNGDIWHETNGSGRECCTYTYQCLNGEEKRIDDSCYVCNDP